MNVLASCFLTQSNTSVISLFSFGSLLNQRAKPPQRIVLSMDLFGLGLL